MLSAHRKRQRHLTSRLKTPIQIPEEILHTAIAKLRLQMANHLPDSMEWVSAAVLAVQAACGSRLGEVLSVSQYHIHSPNEVLIVGWSKQSKHMCAASTSGTENSEVEDTPNLSIVKPCLFFSPAQVVRYVDRIRTFLTKIPVSRVKQHTIRLFSTLWPADLSFRRKTHSFRALYATYSHSLFAKDVNQSVWIQKVLGHQNLPSTFHYADVRVRPAVSTDASATINAAVNAPESAAVRSAVSATLSPHTKPASKTFLAAFWQDESVPLPCVQDAEGNKFVHIQPLTPCSCPQTWFEALDLQLCNVDIQQLQDHHWKKLKVPLDIAYAWRTKRPRCIVLD